MHFDAECAYFILSCFLNGQLDPSFWGQIKSSPSTLLKEEKKHLIVF